MNKKLEDLLNLPESKKIIKAEEKKQRREMEQNDADIEEVLRDISELDKIEAALPQVKGLGELADRELNEVAEKAMAAYEDLMDLGMNVEARYSGRIFEVAGGMLKNAIDAKAAKIDKKLKMIELQLKKQKLDNDSIQEDNSVSIPGDGFIVADRNSLLEKLRNMK